MLWFLIMHLWLHLLQLCKLVLAFIWARKGKIIRWGLRNVLKFSNGSRKHYKLCLSYQKLTVWLSALTCCNLMCVIATSRSVNRMGWLVMTFKVQHIRRGLSLLSYALSPQLVLKTKRLNDGPKMKERQREEIKGRKHQKRNMHLGHWVISLVICFFLFFFLKYTLTAWIMYIIIGVNTEWERAHGFKL